MALNNLIAQFYDQARAITEEAHETTLNPRLLLDKPLHHKVRRSLKDPRLAPHKADGPQGPVGPNGFLGSNGAPGPSGP